MCKVDPKNLLGMVNNTLLFARTLPADKDKDKITEAEKVFAGVHFRTVSGQLVFSATDGLMDYQTWMPVKDDFGSGIIVKPSDLRDILAQITSEKEVSLDLVPKESVLRVVGGGKHNFKYWQSELFPQMPDSFEGIGVSLPEGQLKLAIDQVKGFAIGRGEGKRPELASMLFDFKSRRVLLVTTNGSSMAIRRMDVGEELKPARSMLVPIDAVAMLSRVLDPTSSQTLYLHATSEAFIVTGPDWMFRCRLLGLPFPDFNQVVSQIKNDFKAIFSTSQLAKMFNAAAVISESGENRYIQMIAKADHQLMIYADSELGEYANHIVYKGTFRKGALILNTKKIKQMISAIATDEIQFELNETNSAVVVRPVNSNAVFFLMMPLSIHQAQQESKKDMQEEKESAQ